MPPGLAPDTIRAYLGQAGLDALCRLVDALPDGAFIADPEGRVLAWNGPAERITGYSSAELLGRSCELLATSGETCGQPVRAMRHDPTAGTSAVRCCRLQTRDGRSRVILKHTILVYDLRGLIAGTLELFSDVTDAPNVCCGARAAPAPSEPPGDFERMVGLHPRMQEAYRAISIAARSEATVLVLGESGTGKELAAEAVHRRSSRVRGPYVRVNCAALNENLLESELFGHVRGAFTGAVGNRRGRFEEASGGTLLLDEIGDISVAMQAKLLRVLEQKEIDRVGESIPTKVDVRLVCATNRDLRALVEQGAFRADLYYRLRVFPVQLPPLRERMSDLPMLCEHFLARARPETPLRLAADALDALLGYPWPGNVRELEHALGYAALCAEGHEIALDHLPTEIRTPPARPSASSHAALGQQIVATLERNGWNRERASRELGMSRVTLWKQMKRLGIAAPLLRARPRRARGAAA